MMTDQLNKKFWIKQKHMTKITDKENGKRRKKYDYLDKKGTTKTRQDYIETDYVNGVKNESGEQVIRPMTDHEKEWLSQFISETEHGNLNKTKQIRDLVKDRKVLKSQRTGAKARGDIDAILRIENSMKELTEQIEALRSNCNNFYTKESDVSEITSRDNERRRDVYNNAKMNDALVLYDITEYSKFDSEAIKDVNPEHLVLENLHYVPKKRKKK